MKDVFEDIYRNKKWFNGSGAGSLPENTESYRTFLQQFLKTYAIKRIVDFGCGDWQFSHLMDWTGIDYVGIDAVSSVIEANRKQYETENIHFALITDIQKQLPEADLILVKDVFQHWPNKEIETFASIIACYEHNLITNTQETIDVSDPNQPSSMPDVLNRDIALGEFRPLDLSLDPFCWKIKEQFRYVSHRKHAKREEIKTVVSFQRP